MGYNSVVLVLNDALHMIEKDQSFGASLRSAIWKYKFPNVLEHVSAHNGNSTFVNAATVISSANDDAFQIVVITGNTGYKITSNPNEHIPSEIIRYMEYILKMRKKYTKEMKKKTA